MIFLDGSHAFQKFKKSMERHDLKGYRSHYFSDVKQHIYRKRVPTRRRVDNHIVILFFNGKQGLRKGHFASEILSADESLNAGKGFAACKEPKPVPNLNDGFIQTQFSGNQ